MKRSIIARIHLVATIVATLTVGSFFCFSLMAEILGRDLFIQQVKTGILYGLPLLIIAMPVLALTGKKLTGRSRHPVIAQKKKRMKWIALNGLVLISLAIYLYYHATYRSMDATFLYVQVAELWFGAINLGLIAMNIKAGLEISGKRKGVF